MTRLDELLQCITIVEHNQNSPASSSSTNPAPSPSPTPHLHHIKLKVPRFNGTDPSGWVFKITQFFEYHATSDQDGLTIASFYMEIPALA